MSTEDQLEVIGVERVDDGGFDPFRLAAVNFGGAEGADGGGADDLDEGVAEGVEEVRGR